ncbi:MAG: S8 family serine peptidase [Candidatus Aminicenantaceae bacterium]
MKIKSEYIVCFLVLLALSSSLTSPQTEDKLSARLHARLFVQGEESVQTAWIFLTDKGPHESQRLAETEAALRPRARLRRQRHRGADNLVDVYDIPVHESYVEILRQYVRRIRHRSRWLNAVSVEARGSALAELAEQAFVRRIDVVGFGTFREPTPVSLTKEAPPISTQAAHALDYGDSIWQVELSNIPAMHDLGYSGKDVLICMLDNGFNTLDHEALDHLDIVATWDFVNNDPVVSDQEGQMGIGNHGTATLSMIGSFQPGTLIGPAYSASYMLGKTENTEWERHLEEDHWVAGAEWADEWGADIISSSVGYFYTFTNGEEGYTWEDMDGETTIVAQGANIAGERGILILNSAGNEGDRPFPGNSLVSPSDSALVLAVGATNFTGTRVDFSSVGPSFDGRIKPDVMAMGAGVLIADPTAIDAYALSQGTSFSCPLAAGVAALVLEAKPDWTNLEIMEALRRTASRGGNPDNKNGYGVVNALKALDFTPVAFYPPENFGLTRLKNDYIFFIQFVDRLEWDANPQNKIPVKGYRIYARPTSGQNLAYELLAEVDADTFWVDHRGLDSQELYTYKITSVDEEGNESVPSFTGSR